MREQQLKLFYDRREKDEEMNRRRRALTIPMDTLILVGIIVLFVIMTSFSLGVKQGRKLSSKLVKTRLVKHEVKKPDITKKNIKQVIPGTHNDTKGEKAHNQSKDIKVPGRGQKEYIIQVASYLKDNLANKEKQYLEDEGFSTGLSKKGKYLVLYVGKFNTKEAAEKIRTSLKKRYSDCFIRRL